MAKLILTPFYVLDDLVKCDELPTVKGLRDYFER